MSEFISGPKQAQDRNTHVETMLLHVAKILLHVARQAPTTAATEEGTLREPLPNTTQARIDTYPRCIPTGSVLKIARCSVP